MLKKQTGKLDFHGIATSVKYHYVNLSVSAIQTIILGPRIKEFTD